VFVPKPDEETSTPTPTPQKAPVEPTKVPSSAEEMATKVVRIDELLGLIDDDSTSDDW